MPPLYKPALIVFHHHNLEQDQALLRDQDWKHTDYYELSCKSELWGTAFMVAVSKTVTNNRDNAMIYLLERLAVEGEGWTGASLAEIHIIDFGSVILSSGYLARTDGQHISLSHFLENFNEIKEGIFKEAESSLHKNGQAIPKSLSLTEEELVAAVCFSDTWNNRQYFVESRQEWMLFSWGTSV